MKKINLLLMMFLILNKKYLGLVITVIVLIMFWDNISQLPVFQPVF